MTSLSFILRTSIAVLISLSTSNFILSASHFIDEELKDTKLNIEIAQKADTLEEAESALLRAKEQFLKVALKCEDSGNTQAQEEAPLYFLEAAMAQNTAKGVSPLRSEDKGGQQKNNLLCSKL